MLGYSELPESEVPPEHIWHHPQRIEEWFEAVKQRRKNPDLQPIDSGDDGSMAQNELTRGLRD